MLHRILALALFSLLARNTHAQLPQNYYERFPDQIRKDIRSIGPEMAATEYSFIGAYRESLSTFEKREDKEEQIISVDSLAMIRTLRTAPAKVSILEKADYHQIILINEAHHQPAHRLFVASLLPELYRKGFRYLSLEALPGGVRIDKTHPLATNSGIYTNEPAFAKLVDEALRLGFEVIGHEADWEDLQKSRDTREAGQANYLRKILDRDPSARILAYCGYDHILEGTSDQRRMAAYVQSYTGIDPLTINQSELSETDTSPHPMLREISVVVPSVFLTDSGEPLGFSRPNGHRVDMVLIHPHTTDESGRPNWLWSDPLYRKWPIPSVALMYPVMVSAYRKDVSVKKGVPLDRVVLSSKTDEKALALPAGKYRILFRNRTGARLVKEIVVQ